MKTMKEFMNNRTSVDSVEIEESKLLTSTAVQLRIRSLTAKLRNETDISKKIDLLAEIMSSLAMLNVYDAMTIKRK